MPRLSLGYTMIELLVALAIVAILAYIVLPIGVRAVAKSKETRCRANLRQLGQAITMYVGEWEEYPPELDVLRTSLKLGDDIFVCPADATHGERDPSSKARGQTHPLSYLAMGFLHPGMQPEHDLFLSYLEQEPRAEGRCCWPLPPSCDGCRCSSCRPWFTLTGRDR